ncbi:MAG: HTH domain-containing protein [bacterium]
MLNLNELHAKDLQKIVGIRKKIEVLELEMAEVLKQAEKRAPSLSVSIRNMRMPRKSQPSLRDLIRGILEKAAKPMTVSELYEASLVEGYQWRSQEPINALNVKMYTDRTFKKMSPGRFVVRPGRKA